MSAYCRMEKQVKDSYEQIVVKLCGEASDKILFGVSHDEESFDRLDARQLATIMEQDTGKPWADTMRSAWADACTLVRANRAAIERIGRWLCERQTLTGLELAVFLNRINNTNDADGVLAASGSPVDSFTPQERALYADEVAHRIRTRHGMYDVKELQTRSM